MPATITLTSVHYKGGVVPAGAVVATVKYKLGAAPDVDDSYTTVTTSQAIATDGTFPSPLDIPDLEYNTEYTVFVKPNSCGIGSKKNYTTDPPSCVDVDDITATISG